MNAIAKHVTQAATDPMSFARYLDLPHAHATSLRRILNSPKEYRWFEDHEKPDSDTLRVGRAGHTAILEPDRFLKDYALWPAENGARRGKDWEAFKSANAGKSIITEAQYETAMRMRDAVAEHPIAGSLMRTKGQSELSLRWTHPHTGIQCKARIDRLSNAIIDLKSSRDPRPRKFSGAAMDYGYWFQMAFYQDAVAAALGVLLPVKIVSVQNVAPYHCVAFDLSQDQLAKGHEDVERAFELLAQCTASGKWPGIHEDAEVPLKRPAWADLPENEEPITFDGEEI